MNGHMGRAAFALAMLLRMSSFGDVAFGRILRVRKDSGKMG
jgi:hypothetical protein